MRRRLLANAAQFPAYRRYMLANESAWRRDGGPEVAIGHDAAVHNFKMCLFCFALYCGADPAAGDVSFLETKVHFSAMAGRFGATGVRLQLLGAGLLTGNFELDGTVFVAVRCCIDPDLLLRGTGTGARSDPGGTLFRVENTSFGAENALFGAENALFGPENELFAGPVELVLEFILGSVLARQEPAGQNQKLKSAVLGSVSSNSADLASAFTVEMKIHLLGHGAGGSVAQLAAAVLRRLAPAAKVACTAFGPAPCFLAPAAGSTVFVLDDDPFPSFSTAANGAFTHRCGALGAGFCQPQNGARFEPRGAGKNGRRGSVQNEHINDANNEHNTNV